MPVFSNARTGHEADPSPAGKRHSDPAFRRQGRRVQDGRFDLNKADLIDDVVHAVGTTQKEAEQLVEIILASMVRALSAGDKVEIRGFGSLHTRMRQGRIARNPKTGAPVNVPVKRIPYFRPSKEVLAVLNDQAAACTSANMAY